MTSHGVDSSASCLAATGRITSAANLRHRAWNSRCSSLNPKSICPPSSPPTAPATEALVIPIDWSVSQARSLPPGQPGRRRFARASAQRRPPGGAGMFTRWPSTADDASPWSAGILVALGGVGAGVYLLLDSLGGNEEQPAPAPSIVVHEQQPAAAEDLGFPAFATKNTTRVAGPDPVADAAGVALAVFPSTGGVKRPVAVSLVEDDDWPAGLAAASLVAAAHPRPDPGHRQRRDPRRHRGRAGGARPHRLGQDRRKADLHDRVGDRAARSCSPQPVSGSNPAEVAAEIDQLRQKLTGDPPAAHPAGELRPAGVRDARRRLGGALGRPGALPREAGGAQAHARRAPPPQGRPRLRARPAFGDLRQGARGGPEGGPEREADRRPRTRSRTRSPSRATRVEASAGTSTTPATDS